MNRLRQAIEKSSPAVAVVIAEELSDEHLANAVMGSDVIEFRVDSFSPKDSACLIEQAERLSPHGPLLATIRLASEGGNWLGSESDRQSLFEALMPYVDGVDVEIDSELSGHIVDTAWTMGNVAILSYHDMHGTFSQGISKKFKEAQDLGADYYKIATSVRSIDEFRRLAKFTIDHQDEHIITVGMDDYGPLSRIVLPSLGSSMTYAFPDNCTPVVSGQLSVQTMSLMRESLYPKL